MRKRIESLLELLFEGKLFPQTVDTEYDRDDLFLSDAMKNANRVCRYMLNQEPVINEYCRVTGYFRFDGTCVADIFSMLGHRHRKELYDAFYCVPYRNLFTLEWQHSAARFDWPIEYGVEGLLSRIEKSRMSHTEPDRLDYLNALTTFCEGITAWADKCAMRAAEAAEKAASPERRRELSILAEILPRVVRRGADSFYEAVVCLCFFYAFLPDSLGPVDRYLYPYYEEDIGSGKITRDDAKETLQELFVMIQSSNNNIDSPNFTRGAECHFSIGGYRSDGEDGCNELTLLIVEALLELPTYRPQITFRWTKKTPFETFKFMLDCERKDKNRRIAFISDEPRIKGFTEIMGLNFEKAVQYTLTGCAEPVLFGGAFNGSLSNNIVLAITGVLHARSDEAISCKDFDEFYALFENELESVLAEMVAIWDQCNKVKSKDVEIVGSLLLNGCVENAKSVTQGGCDNYNGGMVLIGTSNVIDSLSVIKQFVYDEKVISMAELIGALKDNWNEHDALRTKILNTGRFFGNDDPLSDGVSRCFFASVARCLKGKKDAFGVEVNSVGSMIGYMPHHKWFGEATEATPDGRRLGDALTFGIGQSAEKDREGLTALLSSVAHADETGILCGSSITNLTLDEKMMLDDAQFEKTARMLESYFQLGGLIFQLNYVSREDLLKAKANPSAYKNLRVRVSGFSAYFVTLTESIQDEVIARTVLA